MRIQKISFHSCQFKKHILKNDFEKLKDKIVSTFKKKQEHILFIVLKNLRAKKSQFI